MLKSDIEVLESQLVADWLVSNLQGAEELNFGQIQLEVGWRV